MQQTKLLLLLDGLDEVAASAREACIETINTYQSEHLIPLVVCSRREEYQAMSERLTLQSAVIIQPLSSEQVKDYLARAGEALAAVQTAVHTNPVLQELLTTPLMLDVVTLTYQDKAAKDLPHGSPVEQQRQVFEHYVTQALEKKRERTWRYTPQPTRKWLSWLAQQMQQRNLTEFYLEYLEPSWLPTSRMGIPYHLIVGLLSGWGWGGSRWPQPAWLVGLVFGCFVFSTGEVFFGNTSRFSFWKYRNSLNEHMPLRPDQRIHSMGRSVFRRALPFGLVWLTFWVIILFIGLHSSLGNGHVLALLFIVGLGGGLIMALIMWLMDAGPVYLAHYRLRYLLWRS